MEGDFIGWCRCLVKNIQSGEKSIGLIWSLQLVGETRKIRPGLVVSNDIGNEVSLVIMVAPITSKIKNVYPFSTSAKNYRSHFF